MDHPDPDVLLDLYLSLPEERQSLLEHLLSCFQCRTALASVTVAFESSPGQSSPSLDRIWSLAQAAEEAASAEQRKDREESRQLLREVLDLPEAERLETVRNKARYWSPSLAKRLLQEGEWIGEKDLLRVEGFAQLAAAIGEAIAKEDPIGQTVAIAPLRVRAECLASEAQRLRGSYDKSEKWLVEAATNLRLEPLLSHARARFCRTAALLRREQERTDEALALLERAAEFWWPWRRPPISARSGRSRVGRSWTKLQRSRFPISRRVSRRSMPTQPR